MWLTFSDIIWPPPFFFIFLYPIITRSIFSDIFRPLRLFFIFCLVDKVQFSPTYFGTFPCFFSFIFFCLDVLTFSDIIWPPPFFFIFLYPIITRSIFSDIFRPLRLFFIFCLVDKVQFSPTYFGAFPCFFHFCLSWCVDVLRHDLTTSFLFNHSLSNYHKVNVLRHILTIPPLFQVRFSPTYFGTFPCFFSFLSVLMGLILSDIIWQSPFLVIIFYQIITRSIFSGIFWSFPLILLFF